MPPTPAKSWRKPPGNRKKTARQKISANIWKRPPNHSANRILRKRTKIRNNPAKRKNLNPAPIKPPPIRADNGVKRKNATLKNNYKCSTMKPPGSGRICGNATLPARPRLLWKRIGDRNEKIYHSGNSAASFCRNFPAPRRLSGAGIFPSRQTGSR